MSEKGKAILAYVFTWVGGLIVLFGMKDNEKKPFMEWDLVEIKKVNLKNAERFLSKERIDRCSDGHPRMKVYLKDDLRIEKAWNLYCKIREYNMRSWWN